MPANPTAWPHPPRKGTRIDSFEFMQGAIVIFSLLSN